MRLTAIRFAGYAAGQTDFATIFDRTPDAEREPILRVIQRITDGIVHPANGKFTSIIIVGHADRQDRTDLTCDQRRASEIESARDRAESAWEWLKLQVTGWLTQHGIAATDWWETSQNMTWALVFAAAGMLEHDPPTEAQRSLNRRIVILVSTFDCP